MLHFAQSEGIITDIPLFFPNLGGREVSVVIPSDVCELMFFILRKKHVFKISFYQTKYILSTTD